MGEQGSLMQAEGVTTADPLRAAVAAWADWYQRMGVLDAVEDPGQRGRAGHRDRHGVAARVERETVERAAERVAVGDPVGRERQLDLLAAARLRDQLVARADRDEAAVVHDPVPSTSSACS